MTYLYIHSQVNVHINLDYCRDFFSQLILPPFSSHRVCRTCLSRGFPEVRYSNTNSEVRSHFLRRKSNVARKCIFTWKSCRVSRDPSGVLLPLSLSFCRSWKGRRRSMYRFPCWSRRESLNTFRGGIRCRVSTDLTV